MDTNNNEQEIAKTQETLEKMRALVEKKEGLLVERTTEYESKKGTEGYDVEDAEHRLKVFSDGIETDKQVMKVFEDKLETLQGE